MAEDSFVLISLKDDKAKKLGELLGNPTAKKILELLAKKEYTATDLAKELNLPLSTIHYNLTNLEEGKLVKADEFHYSAKGKEIKHYALTNKMVIITPEPASESIVEKLKKILPVGILVGATAAAMQWYWTAKQAVTVQSFQLMQSESLAAPMAKAVAERTTDAIQMSSVSADVVDQSVHTAESINISYVWFFLVAMMVTIIGYIGITYLREYIKNKR